MKDDMKPGTVFTLAVKNIRVEDIKTPEEMALLDLVRQYAHEHWASDRTINRAEDDECRREMSRIKNEIVSLYRAKPNSRKPRHP